MDGGEQEPTKHELRELKKQQKLEQREQQSSVALTENKKKRTKTCATIAVIILAVIGGLWFWSSRGGITGAATIETGAHPTIGPESAEVSLIVFGDFQCPFTRRFWQDAFPQILEKYSDKLRITYWPVPTAKHNYDRESAMASYCADEQGQFWEYAKILFDRQGSATGEHLRDYARELGLDVDSFWQCYASNKYKEQVQQDYAQGRKYGVVQTPTVLVNEHALSGDLPFEDYRTFIEFELNK